MKVQAIQNQNIASAGGAAGTAGAATDFSSYLHTPSSLEDIFKEASQVYGVSENLLKAVAKAESDFDPNATSRCGAMGVMQLMPATAKSLGVTDGYDPYQNIMGGAKYLSEMLSRYDGNVSLALAAYNAGCNNVDKYGGIPPFKETQNYVAKINGFLEHSVEVPYVAYNASAEEPVHDDAYYQSVLDEIFSYSDYIRFLELYLDMQSLEEERAKKEEERQQQNSNSSGFSYQEIRYNPAVMNLLNGADGI